LVRGESLNFKAVGGEIFQMWDLVAQIGILIFGVSSILLVAKKNKWGFVIGLISQPFFLLTALINQQWGLFGASIAYTFSWLVGIYEWFFRNNKKRRK
jgi:nicotinamide riboside transporter PnuC